MLEMKADNKADQYSSRQTPTHSQFDTTSQMSIERPAIHISQSHTNLVIMDNFLEPEAPQSSEARSGKRLNLSLLLDPSLVALLNVSSGLPLIEVDRRLQAIKAVLDNLCTKYTGEWDGILGDTAKSLFHSLGGWKSLVLKLHQIVAGILLPEPDRPSASWSNAWETTCLLSHISRMKVNPQQVQESLASVQDIEESIPLVSIKLSESAQHEPGAKIGCFVDLQVLWYSVQCCGRFDVYLQGILADQLRDHGRPLYSSQLGKDWETAKTIAEKAVEIYKAAQFRHRLFSEQYEWYLLMLSQEGSSEGVEATLKDIETDLRYSNLNPCDMNARKRIEKLLVHMVGHSSESVRSTAVRLLNRFYDSHDWQRDSPFDPPTIITVGQDIVISVCGDAFGDSNFLSVEVVAPSMSPEPHQRDSLTRYPFSTKIRFSNIQRCGFYDYRLTRLGPTGWRQVRCEGDNNPVMGRFIVLPRLARQMQVCSMLVDEVAIASAANEKPSFESVTASLEELADVGFNALHLRGVCARDNGDGGFERPNASPNAVTDRASPCEMLGGSPAFRELAGAARSRSITTLIDMPASVSSTQKHRKYGTQHLTYIDGNGVKRLMSEESEDGTCLLNFRLVETWELLIADILEWPCQYGVGGVSLRGASQWPPMLPIDSREMLRVDPDGERHYSSADVMAGLVVKRLAEDQGGGFWNTRACQSGYANPLIVKITREVWREFSSFLFFTELDHDDKDEERMKCLIRSGLVPVVTRLVQKVSPVYGKVLSPSSGQVIEESLEAPSSVIPIAKFLETVVCQVIPSSIVGLSSGYSDSPLPASLLGRGRAPYTDLVMSLPFIPFLRYGEYEGRESSYLLEQPSSRGTEAASVPPIDTLNEAVPLIVSPPPTHRLAPIIERPSAPLSRKASFAALLMERTAEGVEVAGDVPLELDPVSCLSQYSSWARTRRRRANLFSISSAFKILPTSDPLVIAFASESSDNNRWTGLVGVINFGSSDCLVDVTLTFDGARGFDIIVESDLFKGTSPKTPWTREELELNPSLRLVVPQYGSTFRLFKSTDESLSGMRLNSELLVASFNRGGAIARREIQATLSGSTCDALHRLLHRLVEKGGIDTRHLLAQAIKTGDDATRFMAKLTRMTRDSLCDEILSAWKMGPIMFTTPELGKWSTCGGLGVMVDDLINTLTRLTHSNSEHPLIWVVSPYYERNRKGETGYLEKDNITWSFNMEIDLGIEKVTVGVFETISNGIRYFFIHNAKYLPSIYPEFSPVMMTAFLALMAKCPLEICCQLRRFPSTIVTNDWATGLTAAYAKRNFFGPRIFDSTRFMHIVHNLDQNYEGRIFPQKNEDLAKVHMLPSDLLVDPHWQRYCLNPSRCAILSSDNWGTVSVSYRKELLEGSPLAPILRLHSHPFAHPNGIPVESRLERIRATGVTSHSEAKAVLQKKYFGSEPSPQTALLAFVGRITFQKGIHLILDIAEQLLRRHASSGVQILVGGAANPGEPYALHCSHRMKDLTRRFPLNFWADPDAFFVDGPLLNLGADFGLMPSAFEPGGIVQQEFMVAGTPVIAFKTGGLRDTISEFYNGQGNGFTFEAHTGGDLAYAIERALKIFWSSDKSGYETLRANARASVVTCQMVASAWLEEFYRMHSREYVCLDDVEEVAKDIEEWTPLSFELEDIETEPESVDMSSEDEGGMSSCGVSVATPARAMSREASVPGIVRRSVRVSFKPKVNMELPRSVLLAGSFDQWASRIPLKWDKATRMFYVDIRVPQGKWQIKLIVDGSWICIDEYPTERDFEGNVNNVIHVD